MICNINNNISDDNNNNHLPLISFMKEVFFLFAKAMSGCVWTVSVTSYQHSLLTVVVDLVSAASCYSEQPFLFSLLHEIYLLSTADNCVGNTSWRRCHSPPDCALNGMTVLHN